MTDVLYTEMKRGAFPLEARQYYRVFKDILVDQLVPLLRAEVPVVLNLPDPESPPSKDLLDGRLSKGVIGKMRKFLLVLRNGPALRDYAPDKSLAFFELCVAEAKKASKLASRDPLH